MRRCGIIKHMKKAKFQNIVWKEGKVYVAQSLNVEVSSFGKTKKLALENLADALKLYFTEDTSAKTRKISRKNIIFPEIVVSEVVYA